MDRKQNNPRTWAVFSWLRFRRELGFRNSELKEVFGNNADLVRKYEPRLRFLFPEVHPEQWRECTCLTLVFGLELEEDDEARLDGQWALFEDLHDPRIVAHQAETLRYYVSPEFQLGAFVTLPGTPD